MGCSERLTNGRTFPEGYIRICPTSRAVDIINSLPYKPSPLNATLPSHFLLVLGYASRHRREIAAFR